MFRKLEAMGSGLLGLFVPRVDAGACGAQQLEHYGSCWQCESQCGYWASCAAECRSGCGCQVIYCEC
ncbi:hypothetical protein [Rugosimonospora africana]|uniref:Uncharacterized protein n=1 Tax=Rugosimonospora africana TaxID=556532 RepID=A0A8J3VQF2_9ACTN|nr:hypothetical protein [Rugosimonospora africana]GIH15070.1 hypothetical protein Raf01_32420 [Rugosimonospora africana]